MESKEKIQGIRIIISLILVIISFIFRFERGIFYYFFYVVAYIVVSYDIFFKAMKNMIRGKIFDENFLMVIATIGAFCIGEFEEAVAVMLFYQIGELFQDYAVDKSRKSVAELMNIRSDYANVYRNGKVCKISPDDVMIGEVILVKPGEKIPLDGKIIEGESRLNMQALTGESLPRKVMVDDEVLSGCINDRGTLKIQVSKKFEESTVRKILDLVENASSKKSKSEHFISKFARYYTPIVVFIAVILMIVPPLIIKNASFSDWLYRALSFLVVSCPCALVISIPLSFFGGIGAASKQGILIKGSNYLEVLSNTDIVVCDKTGTITEGVFEVQKVNAVSYQEDELLKCAAYAEYFSLHPIAISLKNAYKDDISEKLISKVQEVAGLGVMAIIDGNIVLVGNEKMMKKHHINFQKCSDIGTIIYVAINHEFAGTIVIADKIKDDAFQMVKLLRNYHIKRIIMLTGDRADIGASVANSLQLDEYHAELLPQDKVSVVQKMMDDKLSSKKLVFIGDGINDAPVLALADIGVAMGGIGSDAAIEASDIVIMTDEPSKLAIAIQISKKTMKIVKQNIVFAITVKILVLLLSAVGLASMWTAVFADVGVSILAIMNAFRILKTTSAK